MLLGKWNAFSVGAGLQITSNNLLYISVHLQQITALPQVDAGERRRVPACTELLFEQFFPVSVLGT